jgi:diguanylate cyclase (GGDEF)-like protein
VLPDATLKDAAFVAERVRMAVESAQFSGALSKLSLTVSLGVALYTAPLCTTVDSFINVADDALYRAKSLGRNRVDSANE